MVHLPFYLCITFQYIVSYFFFIFYSFYKTVKLILFIGYKFLQEVSQIFTFLEMPVNITQYQRSVGLFKNQNFAFRPKFTNFIGRKC